MSGTSNPYSFLSCFVQNRNTFRVISQIDQVKEMGATSSFTMKWLRPTAKWSQSKLEWHATRMAMVNEPVLTLVVAGPYGFCAVASAAGEAEEEIDSSPNGPKGHGHIRDVRAIGGAIFAAGMSRQVYRRRAPNNWSREDAGTLQALGDTSVAGFNAIDGIGLDEIYAVGFGGEIWRRKGIDWTQMDSPTNVVLHRVRALSPSLMYASGQQGVLLRNEGAGWEIIEHDATDADLWGMEWYRGHLYVAGDQGLFRLEADDSLVRLRIGFAAATFRHLHASDGVLLSSGPKTVLFTEDGERWTDITP